MCPIFVMSSSQIDVDVLWVKPTIIATSARRYNFDAALAGIPAFRLPNPEPALPAALSLEIQISVRIITMSFGHLRGHQSSPESSTRRVFATPTNQCDCWKYLNNLSVCV
jgi:hypothetical protein